VGYPPSAVGLTSGIPGVSTGNSSYPVMPAWDMSNFEIVYSSSYYNPYKDYQNHLSAGKYIPLDQAYKLYKENNGTVVLFPPAVDLVSVNNEWDPIVSYYPGAIVQGKVISGDGKPAPGVYVTLFDQYGIPHEVVKTNASGEYSLVAVPGNDTLLFSTGKYNNLELSGSSTIASYSLNVSDSQAERTDVSVNVTTGLPGYYIVKNLTLPEDSVRGNVAIAYPSSNSNSAAIPVNSGTLILENSTYNNSFNVTISNGYFEKLNVPPETYNVSIVSGGNYYHGVGNISVVANSTTTKNITVNLDLISAKISIGSFGISGIPLKITTINGSIIKQVTSNSNGVASAWVTPGNYSVSAGNLSVTSMVRHMSFSKWGENDSSAYSLSPAVNVVIRPDISGNINLELLKNGKMDANVTAEKSSNGSFVAEVPIGVYTIYGTNGTYSYLRTVDIKTNSFFNLTGKWQKSSYVNLSSHITGSSTAYVGDYEIMNSSALISYSFTSSAPLTVQIPIGTYSFSVLASTASGTMYGNVANSVGPFAKISIPAVKSNYVNVTATNLMSSGNYTAVPSGLVILYSSSGFPVSFGNLSSGVFSLLYPGISISGMYIRYMSSGFYSQEINVKSRSVSFKADPITISGSLHFIDPEVSPNGARVTLYNSGANFSATIRDNNTTFNLVSHGIPVGVYYVTVNGTRSGFLVDNSIIGINTEKTTFDRVLSNFGSVKANGSTTTNVYYMNGTRVISPQHLDYGRYYVYAYSSSAGVNISLVDVNGFLSFTPKYMPYAQLNLSNTLGNLNGTYLLIGNGFSITLSSGSTPVPLGYYSVVYHGTLANSTGSYSLSGSVQASVTKNMYLSVPVSARPLFTTVKGVLSFNGVVSSSSTVVFYSPDYIAKATSNIAGQYSVSLPTLNYTVYAQDSSLGAAFLQKLTISPFATSLNYNISMQPAYRVKVYVALGTSTINNNVTLSTNLGDNYTFNSSVVSLLLPYGTYSFKTTFSSSMVAANDSYISVSYSASSTTLINSPSSVFLNMQIIPKTSFKFTPEQQKPSITPKVSFRYKFAIQNTGNVPEFIKLTSGTTTWTAAFNVTVMDLRPGQSANVTGNFTDIGNVAYGNNSIPISVSYAGGTKSYTLPVFVNKSLSYSVHKSAESLVGKKLDLPLILNNTGNAKITLNFKIIDPTYITNRSWIPSLMINNITSNSTTVGYDSSTVINVMLTTNNTAPVYNFNFNIEIYNKTVGYQNQTLSVIHLSSIHVGSHVAGNNIISNYTADPYEALYIGLIAIAVAVVGGLIVTILRGRKR
jgi:dolichyl-diphosphooligosaccharide--protein glycosyltransferase